MTVRYRLNLTGMPATAQANVSQDAQEALEFVNEMKRRFSHDEFNQVLLIIQTLMDHKQKIALIVNHIQLKNNES